MNWGKMFNLFQCQSNAEFQARIFPNTEHQINVSMLMMIDFAGFDLVVYLG